MKRSSLVLALAAVLGGCFDSLIDGPCTEGYVLEGATCVERLAPGDEPDAAIAVVLPDSSVPVDGGAGVDATPDAAPDAPVDAAPDAPVDAAPDAPVCEATEAVCGDTCTAVLTDSQNCGACGRVCETGLCTDGRCEGDPFGHIVAIGHDYQSFNGAMLHALANAVGIAPRADLAIAHYTDGATPAMQGVAYAAVRSALHVHGRAWHAAALPATPGALTGIDVLVVDPQSGDGDAAFAAGEAWASALATFLRLGGTIVVLESVDGVSYRFAAGAGLYTVAPPATVTGQIGLVVDGADAVGLHVLSPYLAQTQSVAFAGAPEPVVATPTGDAIIFHLTR